MAGFHVGGRVSGRDVIGLVLEWILALLIEYGLIILLTTVIVFAVGFFRD